MDALRANWNACRTQGVRYSSGGPSDGLVKHQSGMVLSWRGSASAVTGRAIVCIAGLTQHKLIAMDHCSPKIEIQLHPLTPCFKPLP